MLMEFVVLFDIFSHVAHFENLYKNVSSAGIQPEAVPSELWKSCRGQLLSHFIKDPKAGNGKAGEAVSPKLFSHFPNFSEVCMEHPNLPVIVIIAGFL